MQVYEYKDYDEYREAQVKANRAKLKSSWIKTETVELVCQRIRLSTPIPTFGLCHGTRHGDEQRLFAHRLGCRVLGTEISDTATQFPNTIQWDFHAVRDEWVNACDFVYSNSLDHSNDPALALAQWIKCLSDKGLLIIEWTEKTGKGKPRHSTVTDPFTATAAEVCELIGKAGGCVIETIPRRYKKPGGDTQVVLIFARRAS